MVYANNTDSPVFVYSPTQTYYYLAAGRWFNAQNLAGPWTFASLNLPPDFANIPLSNPASAILASVPGTSQVKDAVLIAQIPTTMVLNPTTAAAQAKVVYTGDPQFAPIEGTTLQYATNTPDKVIQVGDIYYLCLQGVWFMSTMPQGPWTTASSVPQVIYTIPPSSPVYNVTYVTQVTTTDGNVQSSYTAGYLGAFVMGAAVGAIVTSGTGYYYQPLATRPMATLFITPIPRATGPMAPMARLITTHRQVLMAYHRRRTEHMAQRLAPHPTTPTRGHRREPLPHPQRMANRASARHITLTQGRMVQPTRDRAQRRSGDSRTSLKETNPPLPSTTPMPVEPSVRPKDPRVVRPTAPPALTGTQLQARPQAAICTPDMMATCIRTPAPDGRNQTAAVVGAV